MNKTAEKGFAVVFSGHNSTARELGCKKTVEHLHAMLCCRKQHFLGFLQHVCVPIPATGTEEVAHIFFCFDQIRIQAALVKKNADCFSEPWKMSESSATTATLSTQADVARTSALRSGSWVSNLLQDLFYSVGQFTPHLGRFVWQGHLTLKVRVELSCGVATACSWRPNDAGPIHIGRCWWKGPRRGNQRLGRHKMAGHGRNFSSRTSLNNNGLGSVAHPLSRGQKRRSTF